MVKLRLLSYSALVAAAIAAAMSAHPACARDVTTPEPGEAFPGGAATSREAARDDSAFSNPSGNIPDSRMSDFREGSDNFRKLWLSVPAANKAFDGLGPLFNTRSCQRCHLRDGRGHPPKANFPDDDATSFVLRLSIPPQTDTEKQLIAERRALVVPEPTYGAQLQEFAIQGIPAEGKVHIEYEEKTFIFPDGERVKLRKPAYAIDRLGYGPLHPQTMTSPRVANQMIGLGLLEAIRKEDIRSRADPDDRDADGISGRPNEVWSLEKNRAALGRFGWKAGVPSVREQTASAFLFDLGVSTSLTKSPSGDCTPKQPRCLAAPNGDTEESGVEAGAKIVDRITFYSQNLAVPGRRGTADPDVLAGKRLFHKSGCAACHRPSFTTGSMPDQPHLSNQKIWPFTDLLLHDMGEGLADGRPEGTADGREWRTAPLWGIGLTPTVSGHSLYLHDGRARSLVEAILWHGGEAEAARDAFAALPKRDRARLIAFVKSL